MSNYKKEILNGLAYLKTGELEKIELPYLHSLNQLIYYYARREGMRVEVKVEDNKWVVRLKEGRKKPLPTILVENFSLDVLYSSAVLLSNNLLGLVIFKGVDKQLFLSSIPPEAESVLSPVSIAFSHRGLELTRKLPEGEEAEAEDPLSILSED